MRIERERSKVSPPPSKSLSSVGGEIAYKHLIIKQVEQVLSQGHSGRPRSAEKGY